MKKGKASAFFGIILIIAGFVILSKNMGFFDISFLQQFSEWWPIGLIIAGAAYIYGQRGLGFAVIMITLILAMMHGFESIEGVEWDGRFWPTGFNCISGSGNVISESRTIDEFSSISASSGVTVFLAQTGVQSVKVEADENIIESIITESDNGVLEIYAKGCMRNATPVNVYVSSNEINRMKASSSSKIIGKSKISGDDLALEASSAAEIDVDIDARNIIAEASSAGKIKIKGSSDLINARATSSAIINAFGLVSKSVYSDASSAGIVQVHALEKLKATASSAGIVQYKGSVVNIDKKESSAGTVQKIE